MDKNTENIIFYIDREKIMQNIQNYSNIGSVYYPVKANSSKQMIEAVRECFKFSGIKGGFLASSFNHVKKLLDVGVDADSICVMNTLLSADKLRFIYSKGVRFFTVDDLETIIKFSDGIDISNLRFAVRLSITEIFSNIKSCLGATTDEFNRIMKYIYPRCKNIGLSFYMDSQAKSNPDALRIALEYIESNFNNKNIQFVSIGGVPKSEDLETHLIYDFKSAMNLDEIITEPGQGLVGNTVTMKTRIIRCRTINDRNIVVLQCGVYSGLLDIVLYRKKFNIGCWIDGALVELSHVRTETKTCPVEIYGGSSDSTDRIAKMYIGEEYLDRLCTGLPVYIPEVGAYVEELFTNYAGDLIIEHNNI